MVKDAARELPRIDLKDALMLTLMSLTKDPERYTRLARRWLAKFLDEAEPSLDEIASAAELLRDVAPGHERAVLEAIKPLLRVKLTG